VEESTAASESLREQAQHLASAVRQFKLQGGTAAGSSALPGTRAAPAHLPAPPPAPSRAAAVAQAPHKAALRIH
jgi:hypothetical protein